MSVDAACGVDAFADTLHGLIDESTGKVKKGATKAVRMGGEVSEQEWKDRGSAYGWDRYPGTIQHKMHRSEDGPTVEVGSAELPGLPHLLEKGHALVGGGRSRAFVHIAPAAEAGFKVTEDALESIEL